LLIESVFFSQQSTIIKPLIMSINGVVAGVMRDKSQFTFHVSRFTHHAIQNYKPKTI